jgi:hypothetical protein
MTVTLRSPWEMSDAELLTQARELQHQQDQDAKRDPATLLRHLTPEKYRRRPHLDVISEALYDVGIAHDSTLDMAGPRLLIEEPPQTGKTVTGVVGGAFWWLVNHPGARVIIGSYGDRLAVDRGRDVKRLVEEHGARYGLKIARGSASVSDWRLTTGGGIRSVGVGTGVAGTPGDIVFIDDPHKSRQEADSLRSRDRVSGWYSADILSRLAPGAPVIIVMTPWHEDDISGRVVQDQGRIEDGGRWRIIRMPALCDDPERDPLGRNMGDPLPHPKIRSSDSTRLLAHWAEKRRSSSLQDWFSLYMCDAKPVKGALLARELLRERRCYTTGTCDQKPVKSAVAVDPSGGGRDTAGLIGGYLGSDKRVYLTHDWSGVMPSDQWARKACELAIEIDADQVVIETNFGGDMAKILVRTAWSALVAEGINGPDKDRYNRMCPRITTVRARKNKRLRAEPVAQQWTEDRVRTGAYLPELEQEWSSWQADLHESPGRIDASTYLVYALLPMPGAGTGTRRSGARGALPVTGISPLGGGGGGGVSSLGPLG